MNILQLCCFSICSIENGNETLDAKESFEPLTDLWNEVYYKRAFDNRGKWIYFAEYDELRQMDTNASVPLVTAARVLELHSYSPGGKGHSTTFDIQCTLSKKYTLFAPRKMGYCTS